MRIAYSIGAGLLALATAQAHAQQATETGRTTADAEASPTREAPPEQEEQVGVGDIVVTAQKREENLQDVPISITALAGETLVRAGVNSLDAVQRLVPGLSMSAIGSGFVSYTYVRGGGTNVIDAGSDPSVAFFADEIYLGGTTGLQFDLFDIERVEVLKGPQGTLFGRNAAAGAVSVTTRRPSATPEYMAQMEVGNYGQALLRASLSGPLGGDFRYRLTTAVRHRNAFTGNPVGRDPGKLNNVGARGAIEYDAGDLNALLTTEYFRSANGPTNQFLSTINPLGFASQAAYNRLPLADQDFYRVYYDFIGFERQKQFITSLRVEYDLGFAGLTSISAYRNNLFDRRQDQDGSLADGSILSTREHVKQFSQELRLANSTDNFNWVVGLYYYTSRIDRFDTSDTGPDFGAPALANRLAIDDHRLSTDSYAVFGQATYDLTDSLALTLGARYTKDDKGSRRSVDRFGLGGPQNRYSIDVDASFDSFDPAVTLEFEPSDDVLLYASYKRGFKSGGWQSLFPLRDFAVVPFDAEHVIAYEGGVKSDLLDGRLRVNVAGFLQIMEDQQILRIPSPALLIIDNAGETEAYGADIQISAVPVPRLRIDLNATIQRARFTRYDSLGQNFVGNNQLRSPDFSGSATVEYRAPLGGFGDLTFRAEYFRQTKIFFDAANTSAFQAFQPAYGVLNGRVILQPEGGRYELAAWIKNATDEKYFRNVAIQGPSGLGTPGDPLTFGATLTLNLD